MDSLQEECLLVIQEKFEWFYALFKLNNNPRFAMCFEFLERVFSETLFERLIAEFQLLEKYLDILINPHIRHLNLEGINKNLMPKLLEQLAAGNNVTSLKVAFSNIPVNQFKQLVSSVPKVEIIEMRRFVCSDVLQEIGKKCPLLRVLKIGCSDINDDALMNIFCSVNGDYEVKPNLEQLYVGPSATCKGLSFALSHAPSLKTLDSYDLPSVLFEKHKNDLENNCLGNLQKYSLTRLVFPIWPPNFMENFSTIVHCKNTQNTLKICTVLCPYISSLFISGFFSDEDLLLCSKFLHLKDIKLFMLAKFISFEAITEFLKFRGSGLFSINFLVMHAAAEAIVEYCSKLNSLALGHVTFQHLDKKKNLFAKAKLCDLRSLAITNADFAVEEAGDSLKLILSNANSLNSLNISGSRGLSALFFRSLIQSGLFRVHELNADETDVTATSIMELMSHGVLQKVSVKSCPNIREAECCRLIEYRGNTNNVEIIFSNELSDDGMDIDDSLYSNLFDDHEDDFDEYDDGLL